MVLQVQPTPQTWFFMLIIRFSKIGHVLKIRSLVIKYKNIHEETGAKRPLRRLAVL